MRLKLPIWKNRRLIVEWHKGMPFTIRMTRVVKLSETSEYVRISCEQAGYEIMTSKAKDAD